MDPIDKQALRTASPKPQSRRMSKPDASSPTGGASEKCLGEVDRGWTDVAAWLKLSDFAKGKEKFTPTDDLPTMLWPGTGYDVVSFLEVEQEAPKEAKEAPPSDLLFPTLPESSLVVNSSGASTAPMNASVFCQVPSSRSSRSSSVSAKSLGVSNLGSRSIDENADGLEGHDIFWPGPEVVPQLSPILRSRNTSVSVSPSLSPYKSTFPGSSRAHDVKNGSDRIDALATPADSFIPLSKLQSSQEPSYIAEKSQAILDAIQEKDRARLQQLGLEKMGFINSSLRSDAW